MLVNVFLLKVNEFKGGELLSQLPEADQKQIAAAANEKRKSELTFGRTLLRKSLNYLNNPLSEREVTVDSTGKPFIKNCYEFSISHSKDFVALAVSADQSVGIDIQFKDASRDIDEIVKSYASDEEQEFFNSLEPQDKLNWFYKSWAAIEAAAKVNGAGIANFDRSFVDLNNVIAINAEYFLAISGKTKIKELGVFKFLPSFEFSPIHFA